MTPTDVVILIAYISMIVLSAFFSACETAYSSVNKVRLRTYEAAGNKKASKVLKMTENYDRLLSAILTGSNIVNITAATLGTLLFSSLIAKADLAATVSTIVTTAVIVIFGEITPKSIARERPESFCMMLNPLVWFVCLILTPVNELFLLWKKLLKKIFKLSRNTFITEDELKTYVEEAEDGGEIDEHESDLIRSAIEFDDLDVYDVMTPRVNLIAIEENESLEEIAEKFFEHGYSRLPVYSKSIDSIIGILHEKDFYYLTKKEGVSVKDIIQSTICVSKTMKISTALRMLQKAKVHMAVVVDEYGGTSGIITIEDIIEELVGEIWDEHDEVEILLKKLDDNTFIVAGEESLDTMFDALGLDVKEEFESATVGGWVTEQMGKIPVAGEKMEYENLIITVTKATVKRVVEVRVKANEPGQTNE